MGRIDIGKVNGITLNHDGTVRYISVTGRYYYSPQTRTVIVTDVPNDVAPSDLKGQEVFFRTSDGLRGHSFIKTYNNNNKGKTKVFSIGDRVYLEALKVGGYILGKDEMSSTTYLVGCDKKVCNCTHDGISKIAKQWHLAASFEGTQWQQRCYWGSVDNIEKTNDDTNKYHIGDRVIFNNHNGVIVYTQPNHHIYTVRLDDQCMWHHSGGFGEVNSWYAHHCWSVNEKDLTLQHPPVTRGILDMGVRSLPLNNVSGTENTLKVGDRVNYPPFGNGIVLETEVAQQNILVGFDDPPRELHSGLNSKGYYGGTKYEQKCWWIADKDLKVIKEEPKTTKSNPKVTEEKELTLLIRRKGNKVTCLSLGANDFAIGEAKCSPDDTFNFYTGASLALMRYLNNGGGKGNIE